MKQYVHLVAVLAGIGAVSGLTAVDRLSTAALGAIVGFVSFIVGASVAKPTGTTTTASTTTTTPTVSSTTVPRAN